MIAFSWFDWIALLALVVLLALPDPVPPVSSAWSPSPAAEATAAARPVSRTPASRTPAGDRAVRLAETDAGPRQGCPEVRL